MRRPNAIGHLVLIGSEVVGFTWGYEVDIPDVRRISGVHDWDAVFFTAKRLRKVFYIDDLGVASEWRGRGIARKLTERLLRKARERGMDVATLRTDKDAFPARSLYKGLGFYELPVQDAEHKNRTYWVKELERRR